MIRFPLRLALLLAALMLGGAAVGHASEAGRPKAVVELFTSQGCASCPPADEVLTDIAKDPQVIAITLAVDYWDYIGWKDTLAKRGHSLRQRAYAELRGDRMIYTPQMIIDGVKVAKGSDKAGVERAMAAMKAISPILSVPVDLSVDGDELVVDLDPAPPANRAPPHATVAADIWVCPVISTQEVAIGRGENAGKTVTYTNVVRGWIRLGPWNGGDETYRVGLDKLRQEGVDSVVVMVQSGTPATPGAILGAGRISLKSE